MPAHGVALLFAWLGGVAFVAALAGFAVFYLVTLGRPVPASIAAGGGHAVVHDVALFTVFALHHSVLARPRVKRWLTRWIPPWLERSVYVWVASALFAVTCLAWRRVPGLLYALPAPWRWLGYGVQAAGVALVARASSALDVLELAGIRQVMAAGRSGPDASRRPGSAATPTGTSAAAPLQTRGPYGWVRHPVYLGWVLLVAGTPVLTADRALFAGLSLLYLLLAVPFEERTLREQFGEQYRRYAAQVRWRIVPGLY